MSPTSSSASLLLPGKIWPANPPFPELTSDGAVWQRCREELARLLIESMDDRAVFTLDTRGRVVEWHPAAERLTGYSEEEILGRPPSVFLRGALTQARPLPDALHRAAIEGRFETQGWYVRRDGRGVWAALILSPLSDDAGELLGFGALLRELAPPPLARESPPGPVEEDSRTILPPSASPAADEADGFVAVDVEGRITGVNRRAEALLGRSRAELVGRSVGEELGRLFDSALAEEVRRLFAGRKEGSTPAHTPAGAVWNVDVSSSPLGSSLCLRELPPSAAGPVAGAIVGASALAPELAGQEQVEEALQVERTYFAELFESAPEAIVILSEGDRVLRANSAFTRLFGYALEEVIGREINELIVPDERREEAASLTARVAQGESVNVETVRRRKDGSAVHVSLLANPFQLPGGPLQVCAIYRDITRQKEAEAQIREVNQQLLISACREEEAAERARAAEQQQRFLAEADARLTASLDLDIRAKLLARLCAPTLADFSLVAIRAAGGTYRSAAHADPKQKALLDSLAASLPTEELQEGLAQVSRTGEPLLFTEVDDAVLERLARDEEHLQLLQRLKPRSLLIVPLIARGRSLGVLTLAFAESGRRYTLADVALARELAGRAALLLDNARLYQEAQAATRAREEILRLVSHELRNPLTAILLQLEVLFDRVPPDARPAWEQKRLEAVRHSAEGMIRLVGDLLEVTRIETGHLRIRRSAQPVLPIVAKVLEILSPIAERQRVRLESQVREDLPPIAADPQRIAQVLGNLVGNAIRCTSPGGRVEIRAEAMEQEVRFAVSDTGCGIPQDQLPHLFDRYQRARESGDGVGLGLAIAKGIVESHGGRIWAESQVGEGSTFHFTVPLADASTASSGASNEDRAYEAIAVIAGPSVRRAAALQPGAAEQVALERQESLERQERFASSIGQATPVTDSGSGTVDRLRDQIQAALYIGDLIPGDRLPSIREIAGTLDTTNYAAVRAYETLAAEGLVEKRDRSGIYVAPQERTGAAPIGETAGWISHVLTESWEHQIKLSLLPELLQRAIAPARLQCACVDSDADTLAALCTDVEQYFGLEASAVAPESLPEPHPGEMIDEASIPREIREADVLLTTTFHASAVRTVAEALGKPLVVATANPDHVEAIEQRAREGGVTVVCLDPAYGERVRGLRGGRYRDRIRVVLAEDAPAVEALDADAPALLTRAAHQRIVRRDLRLLVPFSPCFSRPCAQALAEILVRLNMDAARQHVLAGRVSG